jgi:putative chitinase
MAESTLAKDKLELERYKADLNYKRYRLVGFYAAVLIAVIPASFKLVDGILKHFEEEDDQARKEEQDHDEYVKRFVDLALDENIERRIRFAEYFANVSAKNYKEQWEQYLKSLTDERKDLRDKIDVGEHDWQSLAHQNVVDQVELDRLARDLSWYYAEIGSSAPNRNVLVDPRNPIPTANQPIGVNSHIDTTDVINNSPVPAEYSFQFDRNRFIINMNNDFFGGQLSKTQKDGLITLLDYWDNHYKNGDNRILSYIIDTIMHETALSMQPIEEYGKGDGMPWGKVIPDTGKSYYGRGVISLTWARNYKVMGDIIGVDLYNNPDLALDPLNSAAIAVEGMLHGVFTGKKLNDYFNGTYEDWINARRIINGLNEATEISRVSLGVYHDMAIAEIKPRSASPAQAGVKSGP